jgi:hypothetical protein
MPGGYRWGLEANKEDIFRKEGGKGKIKSM